jgi:hypothetical protein
MRRTLAAALAASAATAAVLIPATASSAPARDRPPECVTMRLLAPSGRAAWVVTCGSGAGRESPLQNWAAGRAVIMDGTRVIDTANCPKANPCVLIAVHSPPS